MFVILGSKMVLFNKGLKNEHPYDNSMLVVSDPQNYFVNQHTYDIPFKIAQLLASGIFPLYRITRFINKSGSQYEQWLCWSKMKNGKDTQIVDELKNFSEGHTLTKNGYSIFNSDFEELLKTYKIKNIYFSGFDTESCILINSSIAFEKGYRPFVLTKYCASHSGKKVHLAGLMILKRIIGQDGLVDAFYT